MNTAALRVSLRVWERKHAYRESKLHAVRQAAHKSGSVTADEAAHIDKWVRLLAIADGMIIRRTGQIHTKRPLRLRAYDVAYGLVGVMEIGGNNQGAIVTQIIRANGGGAPEPWCGDFQAYCYRIAGSICVTRAWAAVVLMIGVAGIRRVATPQRGDLVRFTFDHVGMYDKDNGDGTITTIEGNTGASGAVSDSVTGGDGVYRKVRTKAVVCDYLRVYR